MLDNTIPFTDFIFSPVDEELLKFKVATYVQIYLWKESLRFRARDLEITVATPGRTPDLRVRRHRYPGTDQESRRHHRRTGARVGVRGLLKKTLEAIRATSGISPPAP